MTPWLVAAIVCLASFVQSTTGFGLGLVSMPLLVTVLGIRTAAPLVSLVAVVAQFILLIRLRTALDFTAVWRLSIASLLAIPLGVTLLRRLNADVVTAFLGIVLILYALYALATPRLQPLRSERWAFGFGFAAGLLSGAYNTSGPPAIVYGTVRRWSPANFKSNLQAFFLLNNFTVMASHAVSGNYSSEVRDLFILAAPALAAGLIAGALLDRRLNPDRFHRLVLLLLIALGARLLLPA